MKKVLLGFAALFVLVLTLSYVAIRSDANKLVVALEPLLPPTTKLASPLPSNITFTLSGPGEAIAKQKLKTKFPIRPDLRQTRSHRVALRVTKEYLGKLEEGVEVTAISPSTLFIELQDQ